MFKLILLISILLGSCSAFQPLSFKYGHNQATLRHNDGMIQVPCSGGSGNYKYLYGNLPTHWSQQGSYLLIPDIMSLHYSYVVRVRVQDEGKNVLEGYVKLVVNKLSVEIMDPAEPVIQEKSEKKEVKQNIRNEEKEVKEEEKKTYISEQERDAAVKRQKKAQEAVANLVSMIQQIKANKNYAEEKIKEFEEKNKQKSNSFKVCTEEEINLDEKKVDLELKLKERSSLLFALQEQLSEKESNTENEDQREKLVLEKTSFEEKRQINQKKLKAQQSEFDSCEVVHQGYHTQYDEVNARLGEISSSLQIQNQKAMKSPQTISQIDKKLDETGAQIEALKKQLDQAENRKKEFEKEKLKEELSLAQTNESIRQLKEEQEGLQERLPDLIDNIGYYHPKCGKMEEDLKTAKEEFSKQVERYEAVLVKIQELNQLIQNKNEDIEKLKIRIGEDKLSIQKISEQLAYVEENIPLKQSQCSKLTSQLEIINTHLKNWNQRLKQETKNLKSMNEQIQKARAEKEIADLKVQEIIQVTAQVEKYPVQKEQSDFENLQKLFLPKTLTQVLAEKKSYPLSPISKKALSGDYDEPFKLPQYQCEKGGSLYEGYGKVIGINPGEIEVENDKGEIMHMQISPCSVLKATKENHILNKNDSVKYEVRRNNKGGFELQTLVCEV